MTFEEFWSKNLEKYKELARKDFMCQHPETWSASVFIDSDDDFLLDREHTFTLYADSQDELVQNLIAYLTQAQLKYVKKWAITSEKGSTKGDYSHAWLSIRDEAIQLLRSGETQISYGGNQTIEISIVQPQP